MQFLVLGASLPCASFRLVYEDAALLVVNKDAGLLTVPGIEKPDCLVTRLGNDYPGCRVAHRLDRDTSGLVVVARTREAHRTLSMAFEARHVNKTYVGRVLGQPAREGVVREPVGKSPPGVFPRIQVGVGRPAVTRWRRLCDDDANALLELEPVTGRPQQLRAHLAHIGFPLLGDTLHGTPDAIAASPALCLHACKLQFAHPTTGDLVSFDAPRPFA